MIKKLMILFNCLFPVLKLDTLIIKKVIKF